MQPSISWSRARVIALLCLLSSLCLPGHWVAVAQAKHTLVSSASFNCATVARLSKIQCQALVKLYGSMNGPNWLRHDDWLQTTEPCFWYGVSCDPDNQYVTALNLSNNGLSGALPTELGNLTDLQFLGLNASQLTNLPAVLGQLTNLQGLYLGDNYLTDIPNELAKSTKLAELSLQGNQLTKFPSVLGRLNHLSSLTLSSNQLASLSGAELGRLTNLQAIYLDNNHLTSLPPEVGYLSDLRILSINNNQLANLPLELGNLTKLERILVSNNQLTALPVTLSNLSLQAVVIDHNQLTSFPTVIFHTPSYLHSLDLHDNVGLKGSLPQQLLQSAFMSYFDFKNTQLCEPADLSFRLWLSFIYFVSKNNITCLKLDVKFSIGAPGSQFTLTGSEFPPENSVMLSVNGTTLGTAQPDANRQFTVTLSSAEATTGTYVVTADMAIHTSTVLRIAADAPLYTPVGDSTFVLPAGIAYQNEEYLPLIAQN